MLGQLRVKNPQTGRVEATEALIADEFDAVLGFSGSDNIIYW